MKLKLSFLASIISFFVYAQSAPAYYSSINFNKTKNELKNDLAALITATHTKTISYSELQTLMKTSDVDPENPANLLLIYGSQASGTHQRSRPIGGSWNREHVYAKSQGTPNLGTSGPGADGHHLRPADVSLNSSRGHLSFDDGVGPLAGKTARGGWYPGDEWKGDVARILMYMYVRYNSRCLPLNITMNPSTYSADFPDILLKWNIEDPVSAFEMQRQNVVANTQKNRNPFIDNPYLATVIWGGPDAQNTWPDTFNGGGSSGDTEAPSTPMNLAVSGVSSSSVSLTWTASTDNVAVSGYDIYVNNVFKSTAFTTNATVTGLNPATTYSFYIVAKDASGNKSANSAAVEATTETGTGTDPGTGTTCGTEDFENVVSTGGTPPASSYGDRTWSGNGIVWTATFARTDKQIYIDGDANKAICIKKGNLKSSVISGGIGTLTVKTYLPFADSAGNYTLKINGVVKGLIPYSKTAKTQTIENINVEGNVVIELIDTTTSNRVSFDNLSWTCYTSMGTDATEIKNQKINIYPNPVKNNEFFISGIDKNETVKVYSLNGQLLQTINNVNDKEKVNLNQLPKGVYFVTTKTQSAKIIVD
ncbi:T9SS type A sorting domain-containing protein [Kaistella flava (ex Peng et al. 2021)]|uniref:T9SS type A sorting domain-containing protein n=1 Tax=Kaistella flava (ex Peng et al. 2021) TaxID=2038776 RepID=A0A7M2Y706_9FLAO|nr:endonuclease [Kaistella flava (ex Peng et al. 2021)]QOW09212.1 T9SS type A sorting domain-containing protein [Kaistella flava (ex Peng et al. 2021)]